MLYLCFVWHASAELNETAESVMAYWWDARNQFHQSHFSLRDSSIFLFIYLFPRSLYLVRKRSNQTITARSWPYWLTDRLTDSNWLWLDEAPKFVYAILIFHMGVGDVISWLTPSRVNNCEQNKKKIYVGVGFRGINLSLVLRCRTARFGSKIRIFCVGKRWKGCLVSFYGSG